MQLGLITPTPHLLSDTLKQSKFHMVLGHLLKDETYRMFYSHLKALDPEAYILCDNSANEGYMLKGTELLSLAESIHADEIIAPDKYHDSEVTINETFDFLDNYYESSIKGKFKVMAVPQGETLDEYVGCYEEFADDPRIDVIGIGYRNLIPAIIDDIFLLDDNDWKALGINNPEILFENLEDNCFNYTMSRVLFLKTWPKFRKLNKANKRIHLLGLYNPIELKLINECLTKSELKIIRSCDSAAPWQAAQSSLRFNDGFGVVTKPKAFLDFNMKCTAEQLDIFKFNWNLLKHWAKV